MKNLNLLLKTMLIVLLPVTVFGQVTWVEQTSGTTEKLRAVQFLDANNGYVCGDNGTVIKTTDGGTTWTSVNISTSVPVCDVYFVDTSEGWAAVGDENNSATSGQIWHTTNGGTSWIQQTPGTTEARFGVSAASSTVVWEVGSRNGPINIDATTNGGTTWTIQSNDNIFGWLYKIDALSATTAFSIGGAFFPSVSGFIIKTTNGGTTWLLNNTGTIPFMNGIDMVNANTGFVVGDAGFIMTTTDSGATWTTQTSGTTDTLQDVSLVSTSTGWACGFTGTIRGTNNGGTSWTSETSGVTQNLNGIYALDTATAWAVGDSGKIIRRTLGTGIQDGHGLNSNINIYPNPFSNSTTISLDIQGNEPLSFVVFDITGNEARRINNITSPEIIFFREELSGGIYIYNLLDQANSVVAAGKLIIF